MKGVLLIWGAAVIVGILGYAYINSQINTMVAKDNKVQLNNVLETGCLQDCLGKE